MLDLAHMTLPDMALCGQRLRKAGDGAASMEEAANRIVRFLYDELGDAASGERSCLLARLYKTHPFGGLDAELQGFARRLLPEETVASATRCLTLLATVGDEPAWCSRHESQGHKAIPLPSPEVVERLPMIAQLVEQLELDVGLVVAPQRELILDLQQHTFNVFHVPEAAGSPHIPAQADFVVPYGVRSVLGFGGLLPSGDLFAVILFSRVPIPRQTADLFRPLALAIKLALMPFADRRVFAA